MEKKNILWINNLRALCILSVFFVHAESYYGYNTGVLDHLVHPFYVNAFFFISGYLLFRKQLSEPMISQTYSEYLVGGGKKLLMNIVFRIIIPSVIFSSIEFLPAMMLRGESFKLGYFFFKTIGGGTYWFTSALVVAQLLFLLLFTTRIRKVWFYVIVGATIGVGSTYLITNNYWLGVLNLWAYKHGLISVFFLSLGGLYWRYEMIITKYLRWYTILPLIAAYTYIVGWHYDIVGCVISTFRLNCLGILASLIICFLLPKMMTYIKNNRAIIYLGQNTIGFYFMSGVLPIVLSMVVHKVMPVANALGLAIVFTGSISIAYLVVYLMNKFIPWVFDLRVLRK